MFAAPHAIAPDTGPARSLRRVDALASTSRAGIVIAAPAPEPPVVRVPT